MVFEDTVGYVSKYGKIIKDKRKKVLFYPDISEYPIFT
jgi:hypothetical protein